MKNLASKASRAPKAVAFNPILQSALKYGEIGLRVIPLKERSKKPCFTGWQRTATTDPKTIFRWFKHKPQSNIGIATGHGIVAIDIDPDHGGGESFNELVRGRALPYTAVAYTGSEGFHYLFLVPPDLRIGCPTNILPGIDVRGHNGQIVVAPSIHPDTGRRYEWIYSPGQGIADAPDWLLEFLLKPKTRKGRSRKADEAEGKPYTFREALIFDRVEDEAILLDAMIERYPATAQGQRNAKLGQILTSLLCRRIKPEIAESVAFSWWQHFFRLGKVGTDLSSARRDIQGKINSTMSNPKFKQSLGRSIDHKVEIQKIYLTKEQQNKVMSLFVYIKIPTPLYRSNTKEVWTKERAFVEALVIHFTHEVDCKPSALFKATRSQITAILEARYGLKLENIQFERLKRKFITRPGKPASLIELAIQTVEGRTGKPSEFELTGLRQLLQASPGGLA